MEWNKLLNSERPRPSTTGGDHREQFERDYDRSVFSSPVKRLQDKAQVFPLEPHDSVRTRLTHSLEVSSVAKGLVQKICKDFLIPDGHISGSQDRQIEAIAATCGLLHDLGNPPFGHSGEDAIRSWFSSTFSISQLSTILGNRNEWVQDFLQFEGNAQTLRIVSKLQVLADFNGLNLTYGTLSALCKYIASSNELSETDHAKSKLGYFASETELIDKIRKETGTGFARNPITFVVEAADDIVYSVADIEDGVKKGILRWEQLERELNQIPKEGQQFLSDVLNGKERILKMGTQDFVIKDDIQAAAFRTAAIGVLVGKAAEAFRGQYKSIMDGDYLGELVLEGDSKHLIKHLKTIGRKLIYATPSNLKLELLGRMVIHDLMTLFWEGARELSPKAAIKPKNFAGKLQALLSDAYRTVFDHFADPKDEHQTNYCRLQLVTDYICGMTDSFAKRLHAELTNG